MIVNRYFNEKSDVTMTGKELLDRKIRKNFNGTYYFGKVCEVKEVINKKNKNKFLYHVKYDDSDKEDATEQELIDVLI